MVTYLVPAAYQRDSFVTLSTKVVWMCGLGILLAQIVYPLAPVLLLELRPQPAPNHARFTAGGAGSSFATP